MMKTYLPITVLLLALLLYSCSDSTGPGNMNDRDDIDPPPLELQCVDGMSAEEFQCRNIDLVAHVGLEDFQGDSASLRLNDIWGWTDPETGKEYALVGFNDGVSFVDISTPDEPVVIGKLEESTSSIQKAVSNQTEKSGVLHDDDKEESIHRDFKVHKDHLFVVSDGQPHGMQVFDLKRLRDVENPPVIFTEDHHYTEFGNAHNIAINEETGYAYVVGSNTHGGGLHIIDINNNPLEPVFAGFHSDSTVGIRNTGYVHDTQCVTYQGSDLEYIGDEICFNSSETHLVIANVTDKDSTYTISKSQYDGVAYAHQGWLTEDHQYFLLDDEGDESNNNHNTRTYIWDVRDLENPVVFEEPYTAATSAIDHNQYIKGNFVYQANYTAGLRILSLDNIAGGQLEEVAYFDTHPENDIPDFEEGGAWSNYPFFDSGIVIVSDIFRGLFILKPDLE